jgi:hypothetical protein
MTSRLPGSLAGALIRPLPARLSLAGVLVAAGVATLTWDYAVLPASPLDQLLYWVGLGLALFGVIVLGTGSQASPGRRLTALGALGAVTWLPYLLRSPTQLLFVDERYHLDILQRLAEAGHTPLPITLFPLPGTFPGLEDATLAVMSLTGLQPVLATRLMTLAIHIAIPMLAYLATRGLGLRPAAAFLAGLVYSANTSFAFFDAVFSYETLGILLFLATWAVIALWAGARAGRERAGDPPRPRLTLIVLALPLLAGIVVTHHMSSYLLVASLILAWGVAELGLSPSSRALGELALIAGALAAVWFVLSGKEVAIYIFGTLGARIDAIVQAVLVEHAPRALFANSDLSPAERAIAFAYPPIVAVLCAIGIVVALRDPRRRVLWAPLALFGPIAWVATTPAILTSAGDIAYRAWPFLFLGVAPFAALALEWPTRRLPRRSRSIGRVWAFVIVAALLIGGWTIGGNQTGRFPSDVPATAAGSANQTEEVIAAAHWLRDTAGEGHLVVADTGTASVFASEGGQRILRWMSWFPFVVSATSEIVPWLVERDVDFVIVDRQISQLPPRSGNYFGAPDIPQRLDPGQPFPAALLDRLDSVTGLDRIYDGGRIVIYGRAPTPAEPSAVPSPLP